MSEVMLRLRSKFFFFFELGQGASVAVVFDLSVYGILQNVSYFAVFGVFSYTEKFDKVLLDNAVVRLSDLPVAEVLIIATCN